MNLILWLGLAALVWADHFDRSVQPSPQEPRALVLPKMESAELENGLKIKVAKKGQVPMIHLKVVLKDWNLVPDPEGKEGLGSLCLDMLNEGTERRTSLEIDEELELLGAEASSLELSAPKKNLEKTLEIFTDYLLNPSFSEQELERLRKERIVSLEAGKKDPEKQASALFHSIVYENRPEGRRVTLESVQRITREDILQCHKQIVPNDAAAVVAGDTHLKEMVPLAEKFFGVWKKGVKPVPQKFPLPGFKRLQIHFMHRPGSTQSTLLMGYVLNLDIKHSDNIPVRVMDEILGGSPVSRLYKNIREKKGWAYGIRSSLTFGREDARFIISGGIKSVFTALALQEILEEVRRLKDGGAGEDEVRIARNSLVGAYLGAFETAGGFLAQLENSEIYDLPMDYLVKRREEMMQVTVEDVNRVAKEHLKLENFVVVVVGDATRDLRDLWPIAPLFLYDESGNPLDPGPSH